MILDRLLGEPLQFFVKEMPETRRLAHQSIQPLVRLIYAKKPKSLIDLGSLTNPSVYLIHSS